jgi:hypothetical protein
MFRGGGGGKKWGKQKKKTDKIPEESTRGGRAGTCAPRERMSDGLLFTVRCVEEASLKLSKVN